MISIKYSRIGTYPAILVNANHSMTSYYQITKMVRKPTHSMLNTRPPPTTNKPCSFTRPMRSWPLTITHVWNRAPKISRTCDLNWSSRFVSCKSTWMNASTTASWMRATPSTATSGASACTTPSSPTSSKNSTRNTTSDFSKVTMGAALMAGVQSL